MSQERLTAGGASLTALILELFRVNGRLLSAGDALASTVGLTAARWQVLGAVALSAGPRPVADLARSLGLTRQSVQRLANELAAAGYLAFAPNPRHRRAQLVCFTDRGRVAYEALERVQAPWANALAEALPDGGIEEATRLLVRLRTALEVGEV